MKGFLNGLTCRSATEQLQSSLKDRIQVAQLGNPRNNIHSFASPSELLMTESMENCTAAPPLPHSREAMFPTELLISNSDLLEIHIPDEIKRLVFCSMAEPEEACMESLLVNPLLLIASQPLAAATIQPNIPLFPTATKIHHQQQATSSQSEASANRSPHAQGQSFSNEKTSKKPKKQDRADRNMKKVVYTPFSRILHLVDLKEKMGIDMTEFFEVNPPTQGGHRTWVDFEAVFRFVEHKYQHDAGAFGRFRKFMNDNRAIVTNHGIKKYGSKGSEWLKAFETDADIVYEALNQGTNSRQRIRLLYRNRGLCQSGKVNLEKIEQMLQEKIGKKDKRSSAFTACSSAP